MGQEQDKDRIRELNDDFRRTFTGGRVMMTRGVDDLDAETKTQLIEAVKSFTNFGSGNDPHGEHDFGAIQIGSDEFFFKIDYFDLAMSQHSVDPTNADATIRVLTIMHADEY